MLVQRTPPKLFFVLKTCFWTEPYDTWPVQPHVPPSHAHFLPTFFVALVGALVGALVVG